VIVRNALAVPPEFNRYELKVDGPLYLDVIQALPDEIVRAVASGNQTEQRSGKYAGERIPYRTNWPGLNLGKS
jgi:hypothetical protein